MAVSFDLFGTLVAVDRPADPAAAVARELSNRGVSVPPDWERAYREGHATIQPGSEQSLDEHARAALASRDVAAALETVSGAVFAAFTKDSVVETRDDAPDAVAAAGAGTAVGVCSNCSVPGLVEWALDESRVDPERFDAVVTSVGCGWRKPDRRAFEATADALDVGVADLVHVGDDAETDGGITEAGGEFVHVDAVPLAELPDELEGRSWQ